MNTTLKLKIGLTVLLILFSIVTVLPSFYPDKLPDWWNTYLAPEGMKKGLDLQGGIHMVLRVDLDKAVENSLALAANDLKEGLAENQINAVRMPSDNPNQVVFTLPNTSAVDTVQEVIKEDFPNLNVEVQAEEGSFPKITLNLTTKEIEQIRKSSVDQALEIIRNRIDEFGVAEPVILRQGENEIVVQLPGSKDPDRARALIGKTAQLEFKLVSEEPVNLVQLIDEAKTTGKWKDGDSRQQLNLALQGKIPQGTEVYFEKVKDKTTGEETGKVPYLLESPVLMTGKMVKNSQVRFGDAMTGAYVTLDLTGRGGKVFANITEKNLQRRLAIILDEVVRSAPVIQAKIYGGSAQITGDFTTDEASDLAIVLRVGALPAPVEIIQNMTVGASLGQDAIDKGLNSGLFGAMLVLLFMVIYYRLSGVIADFALALNILFLFVGLAMLGATLTLPGIAGIILSIGMAVDANVLIFERMREEFALGKSVKSGVEGGFSKAFWSIVDSQVTTLITALALFLFGTGPIKGFAVTLSLGIVFNLFAVLFCTKLVYETLYTTRSLKDLRFLQLVKNARFDFMRLRKITFSISALLVLIGFFAFVQILRGHANLGVDFSGGSMLQYKAEQEFALDEVRSAMADAGYDDVVLQEVTNEHRLIVKLKTAEETVGVLGEELTEVLVTAQPDKGFSLESQSEIGSSISEVLRNKAIQAIAISLIGVILYLALRFDLSFGLAAAAATFHDVLVVLGICYLLNLEITLLIVTALLTLAGYSLNDSVVLFDRIRENMRKLEEKKFTDIINLSINQVLSRSVVTSLTTAMVLAALFFFGGSTIHNFSFALLIGIMVGTYSSIFIASPLLSLWPDKK
jgi:SecD/SecF fusion protein